MLSQAVTRGSNVISCTVCLPHINVNRRRLFADSDDNSKGSHYWVYKTGRFKNTRSIEFGEDIRGVANPIVTSFAVWPVCKQFVYLNRSASSISIPTLISFYHYFPIVYLCNFYIISFSHCIFYIHCVPKKNGPINMSRFLQKYRTLFSCHLTE